MDNQMRFFRACSTNRFLGRKSYTYNTFFFNHITNDLAPFVNQLVLAPNNLSRAVHVLFLFIYIIFLLFGQSEHVRCVVHICERIIVTRQITCELHVKDDKVILPSEIR
uniref:Uncharacterized protein n=1 Tax=Sipha flava TaxID=143950 RepID=A0A2S2Q7A3_9HEMI